MNSPKTRKSSKRSVLTFKRETPKSARPLAFARFAQWLIQPFPALSKLFWVQCFSQFL